MSDTERAEAAEAENAALRLQLGLGGQGNVIAAQAAALRVCMRQRDEAFALLKEATRAIRSMRRGGSQLGLDDLLNSIDAALK